MAFGAFSGRVLTLGQVVLDLFLHLIWWELPKALFHAGWSNEALETT